MQNKFDLFSFSNGSIFSFSEKIVQIERKTKFIWIFLRCSHCNATLFENFSLEKDSDNILKQTKIYEECLLFTAFRTCHVKLEEILFILLSFC